MKIKKIFSSVLVMLFTFFTLLNYLPAQAAMKPAVVPQVQFANAPVTQYTVGDRVGFNIHSPNYGGRVEYRVVLWNDSKKSYSDLWYPGNGYPTRYYTRWQPYGNNIFTLGWIINEPGSYRITVYAKRVGIPSSKGALKGMNCDSYKESVAFRVIAKEATVQSILPVADITVNQGVIPALPSTVKAVMSDATEKALKVAWDVVDTTRPGTFVISGIVEGTNLKASQRLIVNPIQTTLNVYSVEAGSINTVNVNLSESISFAPELARFSLSGYGASNLRLYTLYMSTDKRIIQLSTDTLVLGNWYTLQIDGREFVFQVPYNIGSGNYENMVTLISRDIIVSMNTPVSPDITVYPGDAVLSFASYDSTIARYDSNTRKIVGIKPGTTTFYVTASRAGLISASATFSVAVRGNTSYLTASPAVLYEAAANDGSLASGVITVISLYENFRSDINKNNVLISNLPSGLSYNVARSITNYNVLTINITGNAINHSNVNDTAIHVTVLNGLYNGSTYLTSNDVLINFIDPAPVPMGISAEVPAFTAGVPATFTVSTIANSDAGEMVKAYFTIPAGATIEYQEGGVGAWLPLVDVFGPAAGFPLGNITSTFRGTFTEAGTKIVRVEFREVGTNRILGSKDITATVAAAPPAPVPMGISAEVPEFEVGVPATFTVSTIANSDAGKMVKAHFTIPAGVTIEYQEGGVGAWLPLVDVFGPADGFPLGNITSTFRGTFTEVGTKTVKVEFKEVGTGNVLGSKDITATAVAALAPDISEIMVFIDGTVEGTTRQTNTILQAYKYVVAPAGSVARPRIGASTAEYTETLTRFGNITIAEGQADHLFIIELNGGNLVGWSEFEIPDGAIADNDALRATITTASKISIGDIDPVVVVNLTNDTFVAGADNVANWSIGGDMGISVYRVTINGDHEAAIYFTGTATAGNQYIQARDEILTGGVGSNILEITAAAAGVPMIDIAAITGVTAPMKNATPKSTITETAQYTGTIAWAPVSARFAGGTVYTATITLTPKTGYTLAGVAQNFFTVAGATAANAADSGVITAVFPATELSGTEARLDILWYNGGSVPSFSPDTLVYNVVLPLGTTKIPSIQYNKMDPWADADIIDTIALPGTTKIVVTAEDGITTKTYSINFTVYSMPIMSGTVAITGTEKFGQTLTAVPNLTNSGTPTYQWSRDGAAIGGATSATYTLVEADITKTITVTATADGTTGTGSITSAATGAIAKADGPAAPEAPRRADWTGTSITLNANVLYQFSKDGGATWQDSEVFTGLTTDTEYTFIARVKETTTHNASLASPSETIRTKNNEPK